LPPPLIFFSHFWRFALFIAARCIKSECVQAKYRQHASRMKYSKKNKKFDLFYL
jgi:hypothetical protein